MMICYRKEKLIRVFAEQRAITVACLQEFVSRKVAQEIITCNTDLANAKHK